MNLDGMMMNPRDFGQTRLASRRLLSFLEKNRDKLLIEPTECLQRMNSEGITSLGHLWNVFKFFCCWNLKTKELTLIKLEEGSEDGFDWMVGLVGIHGTKLLAFLHALFYELFFMPS